MALTKKKKRYVNDIYIYIYIFQNNVNGNLMERKTAFTFCKDVP